ncbi:MAG: hypothetical protein RLZZ397_735 [Pseudomonadota bacterium]
MKTIELASQKLTVYWLPGSSLLRVSTPSHATAYYNPESRRFQFDSEYTQLRPLEDSILRAIEPQLQGINQSRSQHLLEASV